MKAIVLCAGFGRRLRPLTDIWPKPALPLLGAPLFRYTLAILKRAAITQVGMNTHHLHHTMETIASEECASIGLSLTVSHEALHIQGTAGGIRGLRHFVGNGDFVALNGDSLYALDLQPIIDAHRKSNAAATMALLPMPRGEQYGAVEIDEMGNVRRIAGLGPGGGKSLTAWHFSGIHVMSPVVFDFMATAGPEDLNHHVYLRMLEAGLRIQGHLLPHFNAYMSDVGAPHRYAATHQRLLCGTVPCEYFGSISPFLETPRGAGHFWAHPSAQLNDARLEGPAWFGAGCFLEAGVCVGAEVSVGPGASIEAGANINRVAVLNGARVPRGKVIEDAIVFGDAHIVSTRQ